MEIFGSDLIDVNDFLELLFRFSINFIVAFIIIRVIYYPTEKRKDYLFTYFIFNILIFFICGLLSSVKLELGFALGLFAVFGFLRYRTEPLPVKEMTYLFIVIGLAIINALSNKKVSIAELAFTNLIILGATYLLEKVWLLTHESRKTIVYENIDNIKPENEDKLIEDLRNRTGLNIHRVELGRIDFLRDTARVVIYYYESNSQK